MKDLTYLLQSGDTNSFKIGHGRVDARKGALQTGNPEELSLVIALEGGEPLEAFLHVSFKDRQIRREWFQFRDRSTAVMLVFDKAEQYRELRAKNPGLKPEMLAKIAVCQAYDRILT